MGLDISSLIDLYKVEYIDDLTEWVINSIGDAKPFTTINRVINTWIKVNWTKIKKYNNGLEKIFIVLMRYAIDSDVLKNIKLDKEVKEFIDFWVEKHDDDEFIFNLGEDMIKYLLKK
jgi:UV DNA damage repair endonuclease